MRATAATVVAVCFCLGPAPVATAAPMDPTNAIIRDAISLAHLASERTAAHPVTEFPRVPETDPFTSAGVRPLLLYHAP